MEQEKNIFDHLKVRKIDLPDDSYFENLAQLVIDKQRPKIIPFYKRSTTWIGAAAAIAIVALLVLNFSKTAIDHTDPLLAFNELSANDLLAYVDDNIEDFELEMIAEIIPSGDLLPVEIFDEIEAPIIEKVKEVEAPVTLNNIDDQDILDYFNQEGINLEDLEDDNSFI